MLKLRVDAKTKTAVPVVRTEDEATVSSIEVQFLGQESTIENIEKFVRSRRKAGCTEIRKAFGMTYSEAVKTMDALEDRGVVGPCATRFDGVPMSGPRPVL